MQLLLFKDSFKLIHYIFDKTVAAKVAWRVNICGEKMYLWRLLFIQLQLGASEILEFDAYNFSVKSEGNDRFYSRLENRLEYLIIKYDLWFDSLSFIQIFGWHIKIGLSGSMYTVYVS